MMAQRDLHTLKRYALWRTLVENEGALIADGATRYAEGPVVELDLVVDGGGHFDVVLASPPCTGFTVQQIGRNWTKPTDDPPNAPKNDKARLALAIAEKTLLLIDQLDPAFWVLENPVGKLRKLPVMADRTRWLFPTYRGFPQLALRPSVTYCGYGEARRKPTDLWGGFPPSLYLKEPCYNGQPCHNEARRGSTTGTQGLASDVAAKIPRPLAEAVRDACERDLGRAPLARQQGVLL